MILFDKAENEYPTHFWISVKSLKKGVSWEQGSQHKLQK